MTARKRTYAVTLRRFRYSTNEDEYYLPEEFTVHSTAPSRAKAEANALYRAGGLNASTYKEVAPGVMERYAVKSVVAC